jgi:peptidoglycan hydrolase-like protein with peptidoglycan-binding domain
MTAVTTDVSLSKRSRRLTISALLLVGLALSAFIGWSLWPRAARDVARADVPVMTAPVERTDVAERRVVTGTLGYLGRTTVTNEVATGTVTWAPSAGVTVARGGVLYRVDDRPVFLLYGRVPAWRSFGVGMSPGPDVLELERNLRALGFAAPADLIPDRRFTWPTAQAVERWQRARGAPATGSIPFGGVVFAAGPLRVASVDVPLGAPIAAGGAAVEATSTVPSVAVSLPVGDVTVRVGDRVMVRLPDGSTEASGTVSNVGRVAISSPSDSGTPSTPTIPVAVRLQSHRSQLFAGLDQAPVEVTITSIEHRGVLAVPVTALLARSGGGYAVRSASGSRVLLFVTTGLFDDATGLVEVSGPGLAKGLRVEVAAG